MAKYRTDFVLIIGEIFSVVRTFPEILSVRRLVSQGMAAINVYFNVYINVITRDYESKIQTA